MVKPQDLPLSRALNNDKDRSIYSKLSQTFHKSVASSSKLQITNQRV